MRETAGALGETARSLVAPLAAVNGPYGRGEVLALALESAQQREEHWVIADLVGKGGHMRTVPIPGWVKATIDAWTTAAGGTSQRSQ